MQPTYSDINHNHFIFKLFPQKFHDYLLLGRYDRPIGTLLLLLPCWWGVVLSHPSVDSFIPQLIVFMGGAIALRAAGCIVNDLWDRRIDQKVERTQNRPLASGRVSKKQALIFLTFHLMIGLGIFLWLSPFAKILCGLATIMFIVYPLMKRFFSMPQLWLGLTFNMGLLIVWANNLDTIPYAIGVMYMGAVFWTIGYDTIYAFQDIEEDKKLGLKSSAILFQKHPKIYVSFCYLITGICFLIAAYELYASYFVLALLGAIFCHLYWQIKEWKVSDKASCLKIFKSNTGFAGLVFGVLCLNLGLETYWLYHYGI